MASTARDLFASLQQELESHGDVKDGLSFLDLKNDTLLSYMIDVCNIVLRKVRGESIKDHPSVERCAEYRVILEKIKLIDQRLEYQLNKLITLPADAVEEPQGINVENLDLDIESNSQSEEEEESEAENEQSDSQSANDNSSHRDSGSEDDLKEPPRKKGQLYRPPKLRSVAFGQPRAARGDDLDLGDFDLDDPDEDMDRRRRESRADPEQQAYEEEHYTRLKQPRRRTKGAASRRSKSGGASKRPKGAASRRPKGAARRSGNRF